MAARFVFALLGRVARRPFDKLRDKLLRSGARGFAAPVTIRYVPYERLAWREPPRALRVGP
jgi:hypothetical protein